VLRSIVLPRLGPERRRVSASSTSVLRVLLPGTDAARVSDTGAVCRAGARSEAIGAHALIDSDSPIDVGLRRRTSSGTRTNKDQRH
jgi:hypothetical protein